MNELTQEARWQLVQMLMERVSHLETRVYDLEKQLRRAAPVHYIPEPTVVPQPSRPTTSDPLPPWPEITCGTHDAPVQQTDYTLSDYGRAIFLGSSDEALR